MKFRQNKYITETTHHLVSFESFPKIKLLNDEFKKQVYIKTKTVFETINFLSKTKLFYRLLFANLREALAQQKGVFH